MGLLYFYLDKFLDGDYRKINKREDSDSFRTTTVSSPPKQPKIATKLI